MPDWVGIPDVMIVVKAMLESGRGLLDRRLKMAHTDLVMGHILDYYDNTADLGMFPILMLNMSAESFKWVGIPATAKQPIRLEIWGCVHHDDQRIRQHGLGRLAQGTVEILNRRHRAFPIAGTGLDLYFEDEAPVGKVAYGVSRMESSIVSTFIAQYEATVMVVAADSRVEGDDGAVDMGDIEV